MQLRSWLYVPADDEEALSHAVAVGADVIVVDLADAAVMQNARIARAVAQEWLSIHRQQITGRPLGRWVRVNALDTGLWREDVAAAMRGAPDGFILPRSAGPEAVQALAAEVYEQEQANQIPTGSTRIIPMVGGTAQAALRIPSYAEASLPRLAGLCWNPAELMADLGAQRDRDASGAWTEAFRFARAQMLLTAHARGIPAIETPHARPGDDAGLHAAATAARADGFSGMIAIDAAQIPVIHSAFSPRASTGDDGETLASLADELVRSPALPSRGGKRMLDLDALSAEPGLQTAMRRSA